MAPWQEEGECERVEGETADGVRVPVVRLKIGEVAEATSVVVLPVCRSEDGERKIVEAPWECKGQGEFGVAVAFPDARVLPWKANRWYKEESILVVADRGSKEVKADDGFYLVTLDGAGGDFKVERGSALKERNVVECLGTVLLVVRPPRYETDDQLSDEDWE